MDGAHRYLVPHRGVEGATSSRGIRVRTLCLAQEQYHLHKRGERQLARNDWITLDLEFEKRPATMPATHFAFKMHVKNN